MSDLTAFAAHAETMATARHKPECPPRDRAPRPVNQYRSQPSKCPGCVTDADRALWRQLSDEVNAYLNRADDRDDALL